MGDAPLLEHVLRRLEAAGPTRIVVNAHHRASDIEAFARARGGIAVSLERDLLGTAGGLAAAGDLLGEGPVLVWNADILAELDPAVLARVYASAPGEAILAVWPRAAGEGTVGLDDAGNVVRLRGQRFGPETRSSDFAGIHVVGEGLRRSLPDRGCLVADVYLPALRKGAVLRTHPLDAPFHDVGSLHGYLEANRAWLAARGASSWAHPSARVSADTRLEGSVIGANAGVRGDGELLRCVVWPGADALAPERDAVVTSEGVVRGP